MGGKKMKNIIILFVIVLIGAGAAAGAIASASLGWTLKSVDEPVVFMLDEGENQYGNITWELSDGPLVWLDPVETIEDLGNISIEIQKPITGDIHLSVDAGSYLVGTNVTITLENWGSRTAFFYGTPYRWTVDQYIDRTWQKIYPFIELLGFFVTQIDPGGKEVEIWDQKAPLQVDPGDYRVVVNYYMDEEKYEFTEYVYFSITTFLVPIDNKIFGNYTLKLPDHPLVWNDRDDIFIPLPPLQKIPIGDLPAIPIDKIPLGEYCNATDSITIYNVTDSIKIYNPYDGYWWFPIFPYLIEE